ncbi:universal stress protein [Burkholderia guangdongensis]|uniref:universal stress protein n=1 Tax=Burkholderia guangdongensis TaxID=1792500 RepID=UPI0015C9DFA7|nr:universal stress protein [Burkholderia guangdongensis]
MTPYHRVLLCYDASVEGQRALARGALLVRRLGTDAHLLAILDNTRRVGGYDIVSAIPYELDEEAAKSILEDGVARMTSEGITVHGHLAIGDPVDIITRYANELDIDLVVVGHHPTSPMKRWWNGEHHKQLIDKLPCGVLFEIVRS